MATDSIYFDSLSNIEKLKYLRKTVREAKVNKKKTLAKSRNQDELNMETCIGDCQNFINFSKDVTKILQKINEKQDPQSFSSLKVGELIALNEYVQYVNDNGDVSCVMANNSAVDEEFRQINENDIRLIFSSDVDAKNFRGAQLHESDLKTTYYLRGQKEYSDKVVKVTLEKEKSPKVEIYEITNFDSSDVNFDFTSKDSDEINDNDKRNKDGVLDYAYHLDDSIPDGFQGTIGPRISYESEYNLPKKITLVEVTGIHELMEGYKVKSKVEISDRKQEAEFSLTNDKGQTLSVIELDKRGDVSIAIPYEVSSKSLNFSLRGDTVLGTDKNKFSSSLVYDGVSYIDASYEEGRDGKTIEIGKSYQFEHGKSFLAVKFRKTDSKDSNENEDKIFYISYSRSF